MQATFERFVVSGKDYGVQWQWWWWWWGEITQAQHRKQVKQEVFWKSL